MDPTSETGYYINPERFIGSIGSECVEQAKLYQDPLYGAKVLSPLAIRIIDTPEFQRLSGLKQLGFSEIVYRGAHHTRFEHSVGTYFMCRTIMRRLVQNHERLGFDHPGEHLPDLFHEVPKNLKRSPQDITFQSKWRGLAEVVSIAALIHDIGHVPFGHTLEDEFTGFFPRHDSLAGPRVYTMLFDTASELAAVFSKTSDPWVGRIPNDVLRRLIYVILSWEECVDPANNRTLPPEGFDSILESKLKLAERGTAELDRLTKLRQWHSDFLGSRMFSPFMSDIIGTTICADLLDYLPRDRMYLGMEARHHSRIQRYFTVRPGTLYSPDEGLRMSIIVTRGAHGGQRRDVATAVLDIMRERYEMAERVYYHHKKAAASAMLAKLVELTPPELRPIDDERIYPAPWNDEVVTSEMPPQMVHLSDVGLIEYLGHVDVPETDKPLQRLLYSALVFRRASMYRTLLVVDYDLGNKGNRPHHVLATTLRAPAGCSGVAIRRRLERTLADAACANDGEVIIYCPSSSMQSKEVDARMEITVGRITPLRFQDEEFTYRAELQLLKDYYLRLWRAYIFVSPGIYTNSTRCKAVIDSFCDECGLPREAAYRKVRGHVFSASDAGGLTQQSRRAEDISTIAQAAISPARRLRTVTTGMTTTSVEETKGRVSDLKRAGEEVGQDDFATRLATVFRKELSSERGPQIIKDWIERQSSAEKPHVSGPLLTLVQLAIENTPKDLWAARGAPKSLEDDIPRFLDSCLSVVIGSEAPDGNA